MATYINPTIYGIEKEYFGPIIGTLNIFQLSHSNYYEKCMAKNSDEDDSTGLRVYVGAHVLIRFLAASDGKKLTSNANVVELGCGTGCVGLVGTGFLDIKSLLLTDGNPQAIQIARSNINYLVSNHNAVVPPILSSFIENLSSSSSSSSSSINVCDIHCETFLWSLNSNVSASLYNHFNHNQPFDIVLGCELMYYRTDMKLLLSTVMNLINRQNGLFIHCHVFRGESDQEIALIDILKLYQWSSITIPINTFIGNLELNQHPDWYNVCLLISGPDDVINNLLTEHADWKLFQNYFQACEYNYDENNDNNTTITTITT